MRDGSSGFDKGDDYFKRKALFRAGIHLYRSI